MPAGDLQEELLPFDLFLTPQRWSQATEPAKSFSVAAHERRSGESAWKLMVRP